MPGRTKTFCRLHMWTKISVGSLQAMYKLCTKEAGKCMCARGGNEWLTEGECECEVKEKDRKGGQR